MRNPRPSTPVKVHPDGARSIRVKRACNGCNENIGDATDTEIELSMAGADLPDVRDECPWCRAGWRRAVDLALRRVDCNPDIRYRVARVNGEWQVRRTDARRRLGEPPVSVTRPTPSGGSDAT